LGRTRERCPISLYYVFAPRVFFPAQVPRTLLLAFPFSRVAAVYNSSSILFATLRPFFVLDLQKKIFFFSCFPSGPSSPQLFCRSLRVMPPVEVVFLPRNFSPPFFFSFFFRHNYQFPGDINKTALTIVVNSLTGEPIFFYPEMFPPNSFE